MVPQRAKTRPPTSAGDSGPGAVNECHSYVDSRDLSGLSEFGPAATYHEDDIARGHLIAEQLWDVSTCGSHASSLAQPASEKRLHLAVMLHERPHNTEIQGPTVGQKKVLQPPCTHLVYSTL